MNGIIVILIIAILLLIAFLGERKKISKSRHVRYLKKAKKTLSLLQEGKLTPGQAFSYLRRTNPYVFEELVLLGFSQNGYKIKRNKRYSGDGGIDGRVVKDGKEFLVQCKRYSKYIDLKHVEEFSKLCRKNGRDGFFVHSGKTGRKSRMSAYSAGNVTVISGGELLNLLNYNNYNKYDK